RVVSVTDVERGGGGELVGERLQQGTRDLPQTRLDPAGQLHQTGTQEVSIRVAADEPLVEVRLEQAVDPRAVGVERVGQLGHGHALGVLGEHAQHAQAALQGQGRHHTSSVRYLYVPHDSRAITGHARVNDRRGKPWQRVPAATTSNVWRPRAPPSTSTARRSPAGSRTTPPSATSCGPTRTSMTSSTTRRTATCSPTSHPPRVTGSAPRSWFRA